MVFCASVIRVVAARGLVANIALAIASAIGLATSSPCFSQTISLGQAAQYQAFEASVPGVTPGSFSAGNSSADGNVAVGAGTSFSASSMTIGGALYADSNTLVSTVGTTIAGGVFPGTNLTQAATDATNAANTAAGLAANNSFTSDYSITGNTGQNASPVNVVNFGQAVILFGNTITINGTASEQFVFNFSQSLSIQDTTVVLNGVSASNVFFNITGGIASISGSTFSGTLLDEAGSDSSVSLTNDVFQGSVISDAAITLQGTSMVSELPITLQDTSIAPELPTIMMAGLAFAFVLGNAGRKLLRRRRLAPGVAPEPVVTQAFP